jgi:two-component system phosphate regulon sensor histidine kinase PhoR
MSFQRVPWRLLLLPLIGSIIGLLVAARMRQTENLRWFSQQDSEMTQEANLLSRTLASSSDRQQWLQLVQGLRKMNWGEVDILADSTLSDRARRSLVVSPTQWIPEPDGFYRICVRQPIKDPTASAPSEWMLYSRRVRKADLPWVLRAMIFGALGFAGGLALATILWQTTTATTKLRDTLQWIRTRVKRPIPRTEFLGMFPQSLNADPVGRELIALCDQLHQNAYTNLSGSETSDAILSAMPEGILAFSSELRLLFANRAAVKLLNLGTRIQESIPLIELIRQPKLLQLVQDVQSRQQPLDCEFDTTDATDQTVSLRIRGYCISSDSKPVTTLKNPIRARAYTPELPSGPAASVLLVISDETRVKQLESYRKDFTANVSHELKTPLSAIKAYSETLLMGALDDPDARYRFVTSISEQSSKLEQLIRGLMQLNRIQAMPEKLSLSPLRLADVISSVVKEHRTVADSNQIVIKNQIEHSSEAPDPMVLAEFDALRTILGNLLSNAIRYSKQGGTVTLRCEASKDRIDLLVIDRGIGIPASDVDRIFERFYTVDKARSRDSGGTGLGLAIVKHLTIAIGGSISVQSQLGVGSTFRLSLQRPIDDDPKSNTQNLRSAN